MNWKTDDFIYLILFTTVHLWNFSLHHKKYCNFCVLFSYLIHVVYCPQMSRYVYLVGKNTKIYNFGSLWNVRWLVYRQDKKESFCYMQNLLKINITKKCDTGKLSHLQKSCNCSVMIYHIMICCIFYGCIKSSKIPANLN